MNKIISIDPGRFKCGLVLADLEKKEIIEAIVVSSTSLVENIKMLLNKYKEIKVIMGNGTTSREHQQSLKFLGKNLIIFEEKSTTFRSKYRYFELFPLRGFRRFFPSDLFILDINLDAIAALVILEDYLNFKFESFPLQSKTWKK
tara:strand:+ start:1595 stop:2029 length:435 start_codon:yes stop_codon:yes gene_type:complete